jgi:hypothetical protein
VVVENETPDASLYAARICCLEQPIYSQAQEQLNKTIRAERLLSTCRVRRGKDPLNVIDVNDIKHPCPLLGNTGCRVHSATASFGTAE